MPAIPMSELASPGLTPTTPARPSGSVSAAAGGAPGASAGGHRGGDTDVDMERANANQDHKGSASGDDDDHNAGQEKEDEEEEEEEEAEEEATNSSNPSVSPNNAGDQDPGRLPADSGRGTSATPGSGIQGRRDIPEAAVHLLSLNDVLEQSEAGVMPSRHLRPAPFQNVVPSRFVAPPKRIPGGHTFIVGIPATTDSVGQDAHLEDGYGGIEALIQFLGLSEQDLLDLETLLGPNNDARSKILRPWNQDPPNLNQLERMLSSLELRRELASVIRHFNPERLAEKTFHTMSFLRVVLDELRKVKSQLQSKGHDVESIQAVRAELNQAKRENWGLHDFFKAESDKIKKKMESAKSTAQDDFERLATEHLEQEQASAAKIQELEHKLALAETENRRLRERLRKKTFRAEDLMTFLNQGRNEVRNNWPRLRRLLKLFEHGKLPPPSWQTWVQVDAVDKPSRMIPPYPGPAPADSEDDVDNNGPDDDQVGEIQDENGSQNLDQEEKMEDNPSPPPRSKTAPLSPGGPSPPAKPPGQRQWHPSRMVETNSGPRSPKHPLLLTIEEGRAMLPDFVAWEQVRTDVQLVILTGVGYKGAMEWIREDRVAHTLFHRPQLLDMLARMMYWAVLDDTYWARYVPESYFRMAELICQHALKSGRALDEWPPLEGVQQSEVVEILGDDEEEEDSHRSDESYSERKKSKKSSKRKRRPKSKSKHASSKLSKVSRPESGSGTESDTEGRSKSPAQKRTRSSSVARSESNRSIQGTPKGSKPKLKPSPRTGPAPHQTVLAAKPYEELTQEEIDIIEEPGRGILSWRIYGVAALFTPRTALVLSQTPGYPDYAPQKSESYILQDRWDEVEYRKIIDDEPWLDMFQERIKVLYFHLRADLADSVLDQLVEIVEFMKEWAREIWEILHWITIKTKGKTPAETKALAESKKLNDSRAKRRDKVAQKFQKLKKRLLSEGFPESLFEEPGVWQYPNQICHLFLMDPGTKKENGDSYSWIEQIQMAEADEPTRRQWGEGYTDEERLKHVSPGVKKNLLKPEERMDNWVSLKYRA